MTYNGYTNWDTWNWELWVDNTESIYFWKQEQFEDGGEPTMGTLIRCNELFSPGASDGVDIEKIDWTQLLSHWENEYKDWKEYQEEN